MPSTQQHHPNLEYAPPVIRAPSPASTIGTVYGEDQTSFSDSEGVLIQHAFEAKWLDRLGLDLPRPEEELAEKDPLIVRLPAGSDEEKSGCVVCTFCIHAVLTPPCATFIRAVRKHPGISTRPDTEFGGE